MLRRCYDPNAVVKHRYADRGITVCEDWKLFSNFYNWCLTQPNFYKSGYVLDKDFKLSISSIYSPETCCFITPRLNSLLVNTDNSRGFTKHGKKYVPACAFLPTVFETQEEALSHHNEFNNLKCKELVDLEILKGYLHEGMRTNIYLKIDMTYPI